MKILTLTATDKKGDKIVSDFHKNFLTSKLARKYTESHVIIELKE